MVRQPASPETKAKRERANALAKFLKAEGIAVQVVRHKTYSTVVIWHSLEGTDWEIMQEVQDVSRLVGRFYHASPGEKVPVVWSMQHEHPLYEGSILVRNSGDGNLGTILGYSWSTDRKLLRVVTRDGILSLVVKSGKTTLNTVF